MKNQKLEIKKEEIKEIELSIQEVQDDSVIVRVDNWRMRIYFEQGVKSDKFRVNQPIIAKYTGKLEDVHTIQFKKLK